MRTVFSRKTVLLTLGKQGENLAQKTIFFDPIDWAKDYGPGTVQLLHQRPGEDTPYPVVIAAGADGSYSWTVTAADTALAGRGQCELRYLSGDTVVKSRTWNTIVGDALGEPSETPPEAQQGWVDQVLAAGSAAQEAVKRAEDAAIRQPYPNEETGTWWIWDTETEAYGDSEIPYGTDTLAPMSAAALGGAMADPAEEGDTQPVRIGKDYKLYTAPAAGGASGDCIPAPASAEVGQTIVVKAVNENGKPTEWETVDLPGGGEAAEEIWELLGDVTLEENASSVIFSDIGLETYKKFAYEFSANADSGTQVFVNVNGANATTYAVGNIPYAGAGYRRMRGEINQNLQGYTLGWFATYSSTSDNGDLEWSDREGVYLTVREKVVSFKYAQFPISKIKIWVNAGNMKTGGRIMLWGAK